MEKRQGPREGPLEEVNSPRTTEEDDTDMDQRPGGADSANEAASRSREADSATESEGSVDHRRLRLWTEGFNRDLSAEPHFKDFGKVLWRHLRLLPTRLGALASALDEHGT